MTHWLTPGLFIATDHILCIWCGLVMIMSSKSNFVKAALNASSVFILYNGQNFPPVLPPAVVDWDPIWYNVLSTPYRTSICYSPCVQCKPRDRLTHSTTGSSIAVGHIVHVVHSVWRSNNSFAYSKCILLFGCIAVNFTLERLVASDWLCVLYGQFLSCFLRASTTL